MISRPRLLLGALAGGAVAATAVGWNARRLAVHDLPVPFAHRTTPWATSRTCQPCHPDHYASWHRTFHRTMTQEAGPASVLGAFDGQVVRLWGVATRPLREGDAFYFEYLRANGKPFKRLRVERTVGSRRYQQYLVRGQGADDRENYYRLPLLWHVGERRWIHLNGAFLGPDDVTFDAHVAVWNQNCIFCHNTGPVPGSLNYDTLEARSARGESVSWEYEPRYRSSVAELGVACGSCHAPGREHAVRNRNPVRRYLLHLSGRRDPTIVNPAHLEKERSLAVCGQCHGQRLPQPRSDVRQWMISGPVYRAGEDLRASLEPIFRETEPPSADRPDVFRQRFWADGTPRLTAYEYQGLLLSPCYTKGEMTCLSCHTMHGGDVRGQLPPENRTNRACLPCHRSIARDVSAHTRHRAESSGSSCYECHMPRAVYGILEIHRSHRIENPDPARDAEAGRPNACTSCHLDRSPHWAASVMRKEWGVRYRDPKARADGAPLDLPEPLAALLAGDPVQRAVAARLAGRDDTPLPPAARAFLVPPLLLALEDRYPTVRFFARRSLLDLEGAMTRSGVATGLATGLERFDYIGPAAERASAVAALRSAWEAAGKGAFAPPPPHALLDGRYVLDEGAARRLIALQSAKAIHIGE